ncbi:consortin [Ambystoma mexicanum]|uniref:consortin n=1 Tax=Ambystoma mexicanum TaxID=8296 RepID=UPI0037E70330
MKGNSAAMEMNPGEMPTDGLVAGDDTQSAESLLPLHSDENENLLASSPGEAATEVDEGTGLEEQVAEDSINNNERCNHSDGSQSHEGSCREDKREMRPAAEHPGAEGKPARRRSPRNTKGFNGHPSGVTSGQSVPVPEDMPSDLVQEIVLEANVNHQLSERKRRLQSLFSLIREEFETHDVASLPQYLHQIADNYFQEEDYEKAMQFIQLERLYHEQLLANLSAIQEHWETKRKKMVPEKRASEFSEKGLNSEELERLAQLCASHQEPGLSKHKVLIPERLLIGGTTEFEELREKVVATCQFDRESWTGADPRRGSQEGAMERSVRTLPESTADCLSEDGSLQAAQRQGHMEDSYGNDESTLEAHIQSQEPVGRPRSDCLSSGDARNDISCIRLHRPQPQKDKSEKDNVSGDPEEGLPMVESSVLHAQLDSEPTDGFLKTGANFLRLKHCNDSIQTNAGQPGNNIPGLHLPGPEGEGSGRSLQDRIDLSEKVCNNKTFGHRNASLPGVVGMKAGEQITHESTDSMLDWDRRDTEEYEGSLDCSLDNSESLPDEEVSYSPGEAVLEDNNISLDELAKRIEVEEFSPAEGLVSILKKQNESEGQKLSQIQQKQAKRRVRFQEMDDALDQDELGGGSCFVLILLCAATVFLSIGGTALYCAFGYVESPVCTDFADNMDFYYTRLLQGMEELKHWVYFS